MDIQNGRISDKDSLYINDDVSTQSNVDIEEKKIGEDYSPTHVKSYLDQDSQSLSNGFS